MKSLLRAEKSNCEYSNLPDQYYKLDLEEDHSRHTASRRHSQTNCHFFTTRYFIDCWCKIIHTGCKSFVCCLGAEHALNPGNLSCDKQDNDEAKPFSAAVVKPPCWRWILGAFVCRCASTGGSSDQTTRPLEGRPPHSPTHFNPGQQRSDSTCSRKRSPICNLGHRLSQSWW